MTPFLKELAEHLLKKYPEQLDQVTVVFPNIRAGLFFKKYLSELIDRPIWSPHILSLEDFIKSHSSLQLLDKLSLVFRLYEVYKKHNPKEEGFDRFMYWGDLLLKDFDDIDKYAINAKVLFTDLARQKELDSTFDYLSEEQKNSILEFWKSFEGDPSLQQKSFRQVWNTLYTIYEEFKLILKKEGLAYQGMLYAEVTEQLQAEQLSYGYEKVVFAGFNALNNREEQLITLFIENRDAEVFWDVDAYYVDDEVQEAGLFFRKYRSKKAFSESFPPVLPSHLSNGSSKKKIDIIGVPLSVGQSKLLGQQWRERLEGAGLSDMEKTVVVLPDETLLFSVLHSIPEEVDSINVTMGFPLQGTPLYQFFEHLLALQQHIRTQNNAAHFYHRDVLILLKHPYLRDYNSELASKNIRAIESENKIYLSNDDIFEDEQLYSIIFQEVSKGNAIFDYLIDILLYVTTGNEQEEDVSQKDRPMDSDIFEQEYAYFFYTQLNRLKDIIGQQKIHLDLNGFIRLFRQVMQSVRLPFTGEPLKGLQVMGVLETRNLDFEQVYVLSMNEDIFPASGKLHSFIPYNLRKAYGLPTYDQQDAIYAYLFYRLLQRAEKITLLYNTESGLNIGGEMSRFLLQLMYSDDFSVRRYLLSNTIELREVKEIIIRKDEAVLHDLNRFVLNDGESAKRLTPSALNLYLSCRLRFYFRYVARIYEADTVTEEIDPMAFGNLLHKTMELVYERFIGEKGSGHIMKEDIGTLTGMVDTVLVQAFKEHYGIKEYRPFQFEGRNVIAKAIIRKFALKVLEIDREYAPFEILGLELGEKEGEALTLDFPIENGQRNIGMRGIIDRVDRKGSRVRVLDYKTGKDNKRMGTVASLFDREDDKRNKAAMQTLYYAYLYLENYPAAEGEIMPGVYNSKEMFKESFDMRLEKKVSPNKNSYAPVNDVRPLLDEFKMGLRDLLEEIFDATVPFDQTDDKKSCLTCPYRNICHR